MNNLKSQAKSKLGYVNSAKVNLEGTLSIIYKDDKEIYKVDKQNKFYLIESNFDESNFIILNDNKVKYNGQIVSLEQAKYLFTLDDEDTRYVITYENGNKEDITESIEIKLTEGLLESAHVKMSLIIVRLILDVVLNAE